MSLVIAFNLNDYAILATDRRGIVNFKHGDEETELFRTDQCKKIRQVPFGFYVCAGDYFLTECFDIEANRKDVETRRLDQVLTDTHTRYCHLKGVAHFQEKTTMVLIAQGTDENKIDQILEISFGIDRIGIEEVEPMSLVALMSAMNSNKTFWRDIGYNNLQRIEQFDSTAQFLDYHISLMRYIWTEQLKFDDRISSHIDLYCHHKVTSTGIFIPSEYLNSKYYLEPFSLWAKAQLL